jgi:hypothetical protein
MRNPPRPGRWNFPKQTDVINHPADREKTPYGVFPRPSRGAQFRWARIGDVIPGSFPAVLRTDIDFARGKAAPEGGPS